MSLINEALKKAQRQRSLQNAPLSSAPSGVAAAAVSTHERAASHRSSRAPVWFGLGLLVLGAGATALIMHYGMGGGTPAPAPVATSPTPPAVASAPAPVVAAPPPVVVAAPPETGVVLPPIVHPAPAATAPAPAAPVAPVAQTPAVAAPAAPEATPPVAPEVVAVAPVPAPPPAPLTPAEREARIYAFLSAVRLAGVRGVDAQARVLMNEKVYRLNETVDAELGLRLSSVRPGLLVFTDAQGKTYEKAY